MNIIPAQSQTGDRPATTSKAPRQSLIQDTAQSGRTLGTTDTSTASPKGGVSARAASNISPQHPRRTRLLRRVLATMVGVAGLSALTAPTAFADIYASNSGKAMEWVVCNATNHTVTLNFITNGNTPGYWQLKGTGFEIPSINPPLAVQVQIQYYINGKWHTIPYSPLRYGTTSVTVAMTGVSYWYFTYAFANPYDTWDVGSEYATGYGTYGLYSDGTFNARTGSCVS